MYQLQVSPRILRRKEGVSNYQVFAQEVLKAIVDRPISFEVFSDDFIEMERQARLIASWGKNVYVKIPITNTQGKSSLALIERLANTGVKINVTAMMLLSQVREVVNILAGRPSAFASVFAGRIADSGCDPMPIMAAAVELCSLAPNVELLWASPRELLNIFQAKTVGCQVITVPNDILKKLGLIGKDLQAFSLDTVVSRRCSSGGILFVF